MSWKYISNYLRPEVKKLKVCEKVVDGKSLNMKTLVEGWGYEGEQISGVFVGVTVNFEWLDIQRRQYHGSV